MAAPRHAPSSRATADPNEPETKIGDFTRGEKIGNGSFATVYLAKHNKRRSYAAIKAVVQSKLTKRLKDNLNQEISILKSLEHPHIVALFDCIESRSHIYLIMEYCQMKDLSEFMKARMKVGLPETESVFRKYPNPPNGGLNEVLARHFVKQVASALEYLRKRDLVHRDIKPQNLLLNPAPTYMQNQRPEDVPLAASEHSLVPAVGVASLPMLKIADFGFARHLPQASLAETLCGSPLYMAPEILGYKKYDAKADLWSVGTVAYELVVGKPPFRAANHVDLLRKIDQANDVIQFPAGLAISRDYKNLIRALLKRQPVERLNFRGFFESPVVVGEIPGLAAEDIPRTANVPIRNPLVSELSNRLEKQAIDHPAQQVALTQAAQDSLIPERRPPPPATSLPRTPSDMVMRKPSVERAQRQFDGRPQSLRDPPRPTMVPMATAPSRQEFQQNRISPAAAGVLQRHKSARATPSPSTSAPQQSPTADVSRRYSTDKARERDRERERRDQDISFERDYVLVDKQSTEVNAFADEIAARQHAANPMLRRATTQGVSATTTGGLPVNPSNAMQVAAGRRADPDHARKPSFERRYAPNQLNQATHVIQKAINMANIRLFGTSPPFLGKGTSPDVGQSPFPLYPTPLTPLAIGDGRDSSRTLDEDLRMTKIAEDAATRSNVVYGFAEVKYSQLLPATPSADDGYGIRQISELEETEEGDLTQGAIIAVAEEAFVLYIKTLAIIVRTLDFARYWWENLRSNEPQPGSLPARLTDSKENNSAEARRRMNGVVQWCRNRFNECLEKSEVVGRKLIEAQKRLPESHPAHPSNHSSYGTVNSGNTKFGASIDQIYLTSGVTAEQLMYDRAVEMSRSAAISELTGTDISGCELNYATAVTLFEAVLDNDDEPIVSRPSANKLKVGDEVINGLEQGDWKTVVDMIEATRKRLGALQTKISHQNAAKRMSTPKPPSRTSSSPITAAGTPPR
ncbi:hypothetical protein MBLNU459_g5766t1 [Dothideomycetes sp. NU459]